MSLSRGQAVARFALLALLVTAFALGLMPPSQAGTGDNPEITDPAGDGQAGLAAGDRDLVKVYIQDTLVAGADPLLVFAVDLAADIQQASSLHAFQERVRIAFIPTNPGGLPAGAVEAYVNVVLGYVTTGTPAETAACRFGTTTAVGGSRGVSTEVAVTSAFTAGHYECRLPVSLIGGFNPTAGHQITGMYAQFQLVQRGPLSGTIPDDPGGVNVLRIYDRAPNTGVGRVYPTPQASNSTTSTNSTGNQTAGDRDGDGLNDTCEQQYFGGLNSTQNGSGDADGDGLPNQHECDLGTDPTKADTDGDGVNDKDDPFPTDPARGGSTNSTSSNSTTTTSSNTTTTTGGNTTSQSSTTTAAGNSTSDAPVKTLGDAIEKLKSDLGYLGGSAGGLIAVLVLCILALSVRWSL